MCKSDSEALYIKHYALNKQTNILFCFIHKISQENHWEWKLLTRRIGNPFLYFFILLNFRTTLKKQHTHVDYAKSKQLEM